jgi:hypothetical protein
LRGSIVRAHLRGNSDNTPGSRFPYHPRLCPPHPNHLLVSQS